ncbi:bifunctional folylpolyglutamate synthase/dihydrofolate synthase [Planococcus salinus]|uniref:tetrahydrofolate synthase n=1 Tax=Planococcus salinus TaxID=1848460 RepID=A0A3M8PCU8_9BACL|nr:folylpolyglutamate synthase/dihydrofolate synthase family protein [Planococcus salinus]RNF40924.1 bifunctional folylpolyglutamate synthase/dihydrofolate synthase [Planococcus salinus]
MINGLELYKTKWNIQTANDIKPGLEAVTSALAELNNPHRSGKFVHIAGTNGKGSTAALLGAILREHGWTVGHFYSPAIVDVHDQIQLDGQAIPEAELHSIMERLAALETALTDFELLTVAAFVFFKQQAPDIAIIEAGMGGLLDSTNVINPEVAIIPTIAMEHTNFLGDTMEEIARHKAGIIKKWKPVIVGDVPEEAWNVIEQTANRLHSDLIRPKQPVKVEMKLKGPHQLHNARLAWEAAKELLLLDFDEQKAEQALSEATIPNRFEEVVPNVFFDGAHNPASTEALVETIRQQLPDKKIHIVMGLLKDKDYISILRKLETVGDRFTFLEFDNERAMPAEKLFEENQCKIKTIQNGYDILPVLNENEATIVTGSLYLLTDIRKRNWSYFKKG